jgi:D-alanine-D-alanine ligase
VIIGFTYDLKSDYLAEGFSEEEAAEFDAPETIDGISSALESLGHEVVRIGNVKALLKRLHQGERWDLVFNICEGVKGIGREAQVPAILDVFDIPYTFSDVLVLSLTLHKGMTKRIIRELGIPTAPFAVVELAEDIVRIDLPYPLFVKPVAEGTGKGIGPDSKVRNFQELKKACLDRLEQFRQPVLVETFLPGREITVGIVGTGPEARVIGMMEVIYNQKEQSGIYSYHNKAHYEDFIDYMVPERDLFESCAEVALASWRGLDCRDGGRVDLRLDEHGVPNFMEVNPLPGLNPIHSDLPILASKAGISYNDLIAFIINSALIRTK